MRCDTSLLWTLVEQNAEPGNEADAIARHLETCVQCRQELSSIGGDECWWNDAREWLSGSDIDQHVDHELSPLPPVDLSFLEAPSHPEMLGRIGRYDVEGLLGRGGMGVVLRAYDSDLRRSVAVKVMAPEWAASMPARQRFAREAQAAASVAHENVIPIYNVEADAPLPFLVMRYVPGMTLERWVKTHGVPDAATLLRVAGQLAEGLAAAHRRGLVHRDVKPGNVLVGENIDRVWITDFGLARAADSMTLTRTGVIAGTPHYMSPEQARGEAVDPRSDLFSLGCVLYFLCTGRPPFDAENTLAVLHKIVSEQAVSVASLRRDLPPSLVSLVHDLLQRTPAKRPHDCDAVIENLSDAQAELHDGRVARRPLSPGRRKALLCGGVFALTCSVVGAILLWNAFFQRSTNSRRLETDTMNPWYAGNESPKVVSPYVARASEQIDNAVSLDSAQFSQRVDELGRELQQLDRPPESIAIPSVMLGESQWRRSVAEIDELLKRASQ